MPMAEHDWWKSNGRFMDDTIKRAANSPSVHTFTAPRFPGTLPGQKFSSTGRASTSEFTRIERQSSLIPFHTAKPTQLKSSKNQKTSLSLGKRIALSRPQTTMGPYTIMDPHDIQFDETKGIVWSNAPLVSHSDEAVGRNTPGPRYKIVDDRLTTSTSKRPVSLSMSRGKKPPTPLDWVIKRAKESPVSPFSYDPPPPTKIKGAGKFQSVIPTYLDHAIRRSKTEPGPFSYKIKRNQFKQGRRFGKTNTMNWAESAIRKSRKTPSVHDYNDPTSYLRLHLGTSFRKRDDGSGAFDAILKTASSIPSCCAYSPVDTTQRPTSTHIRGPGQAMTMGKRITDVDILIKHRSQTPGPRKSSRLDRKGLPLLHPQGPPFITQPRDLNDTLMRVERLKPGPCTYEITDDDDYFRQKMYGGSFCGGPKRSNPFDDKVKNENKVSFCPMSKKEIQLKNQTLRMKKRTMKRRTRKSKPLKRNQMISISCRCMGQLIHGIKVKAGIKEAELLQLVKTKKKFQFVGASLQRYVFVQPFVLLDNTSVEIQIPVHRK